MSGEAKSETLAPLPRFEIWIYACTWLGAIFYSVLQVYIYSQENSEVISGGFSDGWTFLGRKQDLNDNEWFNFYYYLITIGPLIIGHVCLSLSFHFVPSLWQYRWYGFTIYTVVTLSFHMGPRFVNYCLLHCIIMYIVCLAKQVILLWITGLLMLINLNFSSVFSFHKSIVNDPEQYYFFILTISMLHLRLMSYCLHVIKEKQNPKLLDIFLYCLYLPGIFFGPLITYDDFSLQIVKPRQPIPVLSHISLAAKLMFWWIFINISLHYVYFFTFQFHTFSLNSMPLWVLAGIGYCNGQYFQTKYVVMYGLTSLLMRVDQLDPPGLPKCICRIHLYSDMWRYFDTGLYNFLKKYIYLYIADYSSSFFKKSFASFVVFAYIFLWHGIMDYILIWCLLNYSGVTLESLVRLIAKNPSVKQLRKNWLSPAMDRRFQALMASPLYAMSCLSNFYFFGGIHCGNTFARRFLSEGFPATINVCLVLYCACHVSMEIKEWEDKRAKLKAS